MSWIGRIFGRITPKSEIEKYLDECAEYANSLEGRNKSNEFWKLIKQTHEYIENNKFDSNKTDNLGIPHKPERVPFENFKNNRKKMKKQSNTTKDTL